MVIGRILGNEAEGVLKWELRVGGKVDGFLVLFDGAL